MTPSDRDAVADAKGRLPRPRFPDFWPSPRAWIGSNSNVQVLGDQHSDLVALAVVIMAAVDWTTAIFLATLSLFLQALLDC